MATQAELDKVTVQQIRERLEWALRTDVDTASKLALQGKITEAQRMYAENIPKRQADIQQLKDWAGLYLLFGKPPEVDT